MKFLSAIVPLIACAVVAEASFKPKKPKFGGSSDDQEEDIQEQQQQEAEPTASGFWAQATSGPRDV
jgi:ABC-type cobalt transport system substrate-binding protein